MAWKRSSVRSRPGPPNPFKNLAKPSQTICPHFARKWQNLSARRHYGLLLSSFRSVLLLLRDDRALLPGCPFAHDAVETLWQPCFRRLGIRSFSARGHQLVVNRVDRRAHLALQRLHVDFHDRRQPAVPHQAPDVLGVPLGLSQCRNGAADDLECQLRQFQFRFRCELVQDRWR